MAEGECSKPPQKVRRLCGYNIWHREFLQSTDAQKSLKESNKLSAKKWRELSEEQKAVYEQKAQDEGFPSQSTRDLKQILLKFADMCKFIKDNMDSEVFFTVVQKNDHYFGGTERGISYLQDEVPWIPYSFMGYLTKSATLGKSEMAKHSKDNSDLRKRVENIFNSLYGAVVENSKGRVPYAKIPVLGIKMTGLPNGIQFKHPSSYGRRQLESIIESKDRLKIHVPGVTVATHDTVQQQQDNSIVAGIDGDSIVMPEVSMDTTSSVKLTTVVAGGSNDTRSSVKSTTVVAGGSNDTRNSVKSTTVIPEAATDTRSSVKSTTVNSNEKLVLLAEGSKQPVGLGSVCVDQEIIHGHVVPQNHVKILIEYIKPNIKPPYPLPFDDEVLYCGQFTVWPKHCTSNAANST